MSSLSLMTHRCTIRRDTPSNVDGVVQHAWADAATGVRCLIQEGSGQVRSPRDGQTLVYSAIGFFPRGTDLRPRGQHDQRDQVVMTSPSRFAGIVYLAEFVADEAGQGDHLTAYLVRLGQSG